MKKQTEIGFLSASTIFEILEAAGYAPRRNRIACPFHDGRNYTSFSFTNTGFNCFSCGAHGGRRELVEHFWPGSTRRPGSEDSSTVSGHRKISVINRHERRSSAEYYAATSKLERLMLRRRTLDEKLKSLKIGVRHGRVGLSEFYAKEQIYLYELEELDGCIAYAKHTVSQLQKRDSANENSAKGNQQGV